MNATAFFTVTLISLGKGYASCEAFHCNLRTSLNFYPGDVGEEGEEGGQ